MSIRNRLLLGYFGVIVILMASGALIIIRMSGELENAVQRDAKSLVTALRQKVGLALHGRIESIRSFAGTSLSLQDALAASNFEFTERGTDAEIQASIARVDKVWDRNNPNEFMRRLLGSGVSVLLKRTKQFYDKGEDEAVFAEIFVTNRYGANVGQTGPTEDYGQKGEDWWDAAWKDGVWIADEVALDPSAKVQAVDIGVRVDDASGAPLGVLKAVLNIADVRDTIDAFGARTAVEGAYLELIDAQGLIVHRQSDPDAFRRDLSRERATQAVLQGEVGAVVETTARGEMLRAYAPRGDDPTRLPWSLVLNQPTAVVFADADRMQRWMIIVGIVASVGALLLGFFLSQAFSRVTHRLAATQERLRSVVDGTVDGIVAADTEGRIVRVNPAMVRIFGYPRDELLGRNVTALMPLQYAEEHDGYIRRYLDTGLPHVIGSVQELEGRRKDGTVFPIELSLSEVRTDDDEHQFVAIVRDVTERHEARRLLEAAKEAAEAASRSKGQFLANMSHELRTPLNAIIGYAEMVGEELEERGEEQLVEDLAKVRAAGRHLLGLINDILDVSKIEAGRMDLYVEQIDLDAFLRDVGATVRPLMDQNGNELVLDTPESLGGMRTDATKLRQILLNLLSNAAKFTRDGSVTLRANREPGRERDWLELHVRDTGIGMTPQQLEHVWDAFAQADASTTREFGGTGLGLTISRSFTEMLGGSIDVESKRDTGTAFTVRLPIDEAVPVASDAAVEAPDEDVAPGAGALDTVLVIDDDPAARDLVRRFLERQGMEVVGASGGKEGLRLAAELLPSVIVLDVMMPGMDGWAVLDALKKDPQLAHIPVVMLTMVDEQQLGFALGVDAYVTKPVDRGTLTDVLAPFRLATGAQGILVVEDDAHARELIRRGLQKMGWRVLEARNGHEALEHLEETTPDLILLDLLMPGMDGFELVDRLQREDRWRDIPVIVLTAKDITPDDARRLKGSIEHLMQKGAYDREALLTEIGRLCRSAVLRRRTRPSE